MSASESRQGMSTRPGTFDWKTPEQWKLHDLKRESEQDIGGLQNRSKEQQSTIDGLTSRLSAMEKANKERDAAAATAANADSATSEETESNEIGHSDSITNAKQVVNNFKNGKTDETDASEVAKTGNNSSASTDQDGVFNNFSGQQTPSDQPKKDPQEFADKYKLNLAAGLNLS